MKEIRYRKAKARVILKGFCLDFHSETCLKMVKHLETPNSKDSKKHSDSKKEILNLKAILKMKGKGSATVRSLEKLMKMETMKDFDWMKG